MRVYEVMSKDVETVKPWVHASEAKTRMRQKHIHHLVVVQGTELAGIVSERDLGGPRLPKSLGAYTVADFMTSPVVTVTTRTLVRRAARSSSGPPVPDGGSASAISSLVCSGSARPSWSKPTSLPG